MVDYSKWDNLAISESEEDEDEEDEWDPRGPQVYKCDPL
jgi:hypothetical protein